MEQVDNMGGKIQSNATRLGSVTFCEASESAKLPALDGVWEESASFLDFWSVGAARSIAKY
jgi:hypothetical protein